MIPLPLFTTASDSVPAQPRRSTHDMHVRTATDWRDK